MDFLTREFFDTLILAMLIIGGALAVVRLYRDFTRPLPPSSGDTTPSSRHPEERRQR